MILIHSRAKAVLQKNVRFHVEHQAYSTFGIDNNAILMHKKLVEGQNYVYVYRNNSENASLE